MGRSHFVVFMILVLNGFEWFCFSMDVSQGGNGKGKTKYSYYNTNITIIYLTFYVLICLVLLSVLRRLGCMVLLLFILIIVSIFLPLLSFPRLYELSKVGNVVSELMILPLQPSRL